MLPKLNKSLIQSHKFPEDVKVTTPAARPEKILQFGEGGFLRGFVDWMINRLNSQGLFNGNIVVIQPIPQGMTQQLSAQDNLYTLILRGVQAGKTVEKKEIVSCISRSLNPYTQYDDYLACARNPELRVIVSNTTEAGIVFRAEDKLEDKPPVSYPAKLTQFLYERFRTNGESNAKGFIILPCELIERNGDNLKKCALQTAENWNLPQPFITWLTAQNEFGNTLVDRIVTGYPKDEASGIFEKLGYQDDMLDTGEIFHFWVIEASKKCAEELPFTQVGLDVVWTDNMTPYRDRKVRILNGAHTMTVLAAYLAGKDTVGECMHEEPIRTFMQRGIYDEIIPTLDLPKQDLESFAAAVTERFSNPFIKHYLLSIALNSTSKFKARILPSIKQYVQRKGQLPPRLTFSLAALIAFYRGTEIKNNALIGHRDGKEYLIQDSPAALELFRSAWASFDGNETALVNRILSSRELWDEDLTTIPALTETVSRQLHEILANGIPAAMTRCV